MKKIGKILTIIIGILVLAVIAIIIALPFLVDPNNYKNQIAQAVKQQTGRELKIGGKIGWSVFPWIGVEMHQLELSNAPGFGNQPFARIETAGVKVKLLPLLKKEVVVDKISLAGLNLNLAKDRTGKTNWDDLVAKKQAATPSSPSEAGAPAISALSIGGIDLHAGEISWKDQTTGASYHLHNVELKSGALAPAKPVDIKLALDLESAAPALRTHVDLKMRVAVDLDKQNFDISSLVLEAAGLKLKAGAKGSRILSAPEFSGDLELAPFSPRALLEKLGLKVETADKTALNQAALTTKFDASTKHLRLKDLNAGLDGSKLKGSLEIVNFAQPAYRFDLALDQIDVDRYLSPQAAPPKNPQAQSGGSPPVPVEIPLDAIRKLDADGQFRIGKLKIFGTHSSDVLVRLHGKNGLVAMDPSQAKLYGGSYQGAVSYDVRVRPAVLNINEQLNGVQFEPFFKDAALPIPFSGTGNLTGKVTASGSTADAIRASLNGRAEFMVKDGAIRGADLNKIYEQGRAAAKNLSIQNIANVLPKQSDQTKFSQLRASVQIKNGIASNDDMVTQIPGIVRATGKGTANLVGETLDYTVLLEDLPLKITGPFSNLKFNLDLSAVAKGALKKELEKRLGLDKPKENQNPGEKPKPEDLLRDLLKKRLGQ